MMSDEISNETVLEESEPITPDELVQHLLLDVATNSGPENLADEFIEDFVLKDRPETDQILTLFETPSHLLVGMLKEIVGQSYQVQIEALDLRGMDFLDRLKETVKVKLTELASDTA